VILDRQVAGERSLVDLMAGAAAGGARLFQYRDKASPASEAYHQAARLRRVAEDLGVLFLVNDRCDLVMAVDADGVHLGQQDMPLSLARSLLGPTKLIGISTHSATQVAEATAGGADYLGFGPIFPTGTKSDHEPIVGIEGLRRIRSHTQVPIFAIGGITSDNVRDVLIAGADGAAVISAVLQSTELTAAVRAFIACVS
jgi:thiamine-phosphate pyrophosphorylase